MIFRGYNLRGDFFEVGVLVYDFVAKCYRLNYRFIRGSWDLVEKSRYSFTI